MDALVDELQRQYHSTLAMYRSVVEHCTDEIWLKEFAGIEGVDGIPFWREAYHAVFWLHHFLGARDKAFSREPFGEDIDPRLFTPPNNTCTRLEALQYAADTDASIDEVFAAMTVDELSGPDDYDESEFRSVYHRHMYGLRHGQHHIGRLAAHLDQAGVQVEHWSG